jgi:hypothetical protein
MKQESKDHFTNHKSSNNGVGKCKKNIVVKLFYGGSNISSLFLYFDIYIANINNKNK